MIIILNGITLADPINGVGNIKIKVKKQGIDGSLTKTVAEELIFYGEGYDIIKQELIDPIDGKTRSIPIKMYDDCCLDSNSNPFLMFEGIVRGDSLDWCEGECSVKATCTEENKRTLFQDCLKSTLIWDNLLGFKSQNHPKMYYCLELRPEFLYDIFLFLAFLMNLLAIILVPVVLIISFIIIVICAILEFISFGGIDCPPELQDGILDDYLYYLEELNKIIIGCGKWHPSPLLRNYFKNVCDVCNAKVGTSIAFQSTILNNPGSEYHNTVYMLAPVDVGTDDPAIKYIEDNQPILSGEGLCKQVARIFNGEYRVRNNELRLERKDYFWSGVPWITYADMLSEQRLIGSLCYKWRNEDPKAYGRFEYSLDPVDFCANEAKKRWNEIVEWNQPINKAQRGAEENLFEFGMSRYRGDGITRDVLASWSWIPFGGLGNLILSYDNVMIMNNGTCFQAKLLIWDGQNMGRVKTYNRPGYTQGIDPPQPVLPYQNFNFPYHFNKYGIVPNTGYPTNQPNVGIYPRFWSINNPKVQTDKGKEFNMVINYNCDILRSFDIDKTIPLPVGIGRIEEIEIDPEKQIIQINGKV